MSPSVSSFKERIQRLESVPGEVLVLPATIKSVVSFYASFTSVPDFLVGDELIRDLTIAMLDKGTQARSKLEIASMVEDTGGKISFSSSGIRCSVSGKALAADLPTILSLVREQLLQPAFPEDEFVRLRERYTASFQQNLMNTAALSAAALNQSIFPVNSPNYSIEVAKELERLQEISIDDIRRYFDEHVQIMDWRMAIVGDVDSPVLKNGPLDDFPNSIESELSEWERVSPGHPPSGRLEQSIPDRENLDVRIGHAVSLVRNDPDYIPLLLGIFILGGNFSARLMQTVRDDKGLTYGIQSALSGIDRYYSGLWKTSVTLSSDKLDEGIEATLEELSKFVRDGVTAEEVRQKSETIAGSYNVALSTTSSLARAIVGTRERGQGLDYMDTFPELIRSISVEQVNNAIWRYLDTEMLKVSVAGTLPDAVMVSPGS